MTELTESNLEKLIRRMISYVTKESEALDLKCGIERDGTILKINVIEPAIQALEFAFLKYDQYDSVANMKIEGYDLSEWIAGRSQAKEEIFELARQVVKENKK